MGDRDRREARDICEPSRSKVCPDCGARYWNAGAHAEECVGTVCPACRLVYTNIFDHVRDHHGVTVTEAEWTEAQREHWHAIMSKPNP